MIVLSREDFSVGETLSRIKRENTGAVVSFVGVVRGEYNGKRLLRMEIEVYEDMARNELTHLREIALSKFDIQDAIIWHRYGTLFPGDNIVMIVVASAHRKPAFEAAQFIIDEIKRIVPIWKKEFYEDGEIWVEGSR
ncbi:MAG: molybdenum cofactor biosynthesis protein MoaE [Methanomassiliicoccales archaeon]